ncbi:hypothetical protein SPHINGOR109_60054 [Sphingorhabdus sp. 109]|nr:hypothetical protein SPHINGOR109_60054 [Sphingorhabdus sp. 109]
MMSDSPRDARRYCNGSVARDALETADISGFHRLSLWFRSWGRDADGWIRYGDRFQGEFLLSARLMRTRT